MMNRTTRPLLITLLVVVIFYQNAAAIDFTSDITVSTLNYRPDKSLSDASGMKPDASDKSGNDALCCAAGGSKCNSCQVVEDGSTLKAAIVCSGNFVLIPESGGYRRIKYTNLKVNNVTVRGY